MFKLASSGLRITSSFFPNNQSQGGFPPSACLMFTAVVLTWQHPRGADVCVHIDVLQQLYNWDNTGAYSGTSIFSLTSLADVAPLTLDLEMKAKIDTNMVASAHHMVPGKQTVSEWYLFPTIRLEGADILAVTPPVLPAPNITRDALVWCGESADYTVW